MDSIKGLLQNSKKNYLVQRKLKSEHASLNSNNHKFSSKKSHQKLFFFSIGLFYFTTLGIWQHGVEANESHFQLF